MTKSTECLKCGTLILEYDSDSLLIQNTLCQKCLIMWRNFHRKYGQKISKKYKCSVNGHHSGWAVFLGELPNLWDKSIDKITKKERVQFT